MSALKLKVLMGKVVCKIPSVSKEQNLLYRRFMIEKAFSQMSSDVKWCQMPLALSSQKSSEASNFEVCPHKNAVYFPR
jgi:hypothetical protein